MAQISIIGGGISGLVLGRCLLSRGVRAILYERDAAGSRYGYGITLRSSAYRALLPYLNIEEGDFRSRVAVDGPVGGSGQEPSENGNDVCFRANRMKFEELLREGLDVQWEHKLKDVKSTESGLRLEFENGQTINTQTAVGTDGVHSQVRKTISPKSDFTIFPFAVYNGKRRLDPATYNKKYAPYFSDVNKLSHKTSNALLQISVNERTPDKASISYTYSRLAKQSDDPIFKPQRPISGAKDIPSELYAEVDSLQGLEEPFREVFRSDAMKGDRLLNWLMRSISVDSSKLYDAAEKGIVLLGDSCHHGPILGTDGANQAIHDAIRLAELVAGGSSSTPLKDFYKQSLPQWQRWVEDNEAQLAKLHGVSRANL